MADPAPESSAPSNKTSTSLALGTSANSKKQVSLSHLQSSWFQRFVQTNAGPLLVSPRRLTVEKGALSEEPQQHLVLHKHDHENYAIVGSGSTIALDRFSLQLGCTEEDRTKGCSGEIETSKLPGSMQKETVTVVGNLEENRTSDIPDAKLGDETSTFPMVGSFNFHSREISGKLQSSGLIVEQSGEPSAHISSVLPRIEQQFCSQYRNSEQVTFSGIETQSNKTETSSAIPPANSVSAFRAIPISMRKPIFSGIETQKRKSETTSVIPPANNVSACRAIPISMRKPPLPPGAVTRMKGGAPLQSNKVDFHGTTLNFRKRQKASESATNKVIPGTKSDKEVASAATNPTLELVTSSEDIQSAYPESSLQGKSSYQQGFSAFRNDIMRKSTGRQGINERDSKMVSSLNDRGKHFQRPTRGMTGKVHLQNLFEKEGKRIGEFTLGESLWNNDGTALLVTKASSQKGPGLFSTTTAPILESQDPSRSLEISSNDRVPGNMAKLSNESSGHFKSLQAEVTHCDGEASAESSASEKPEVNVLVQRATFTTPFSPQNREEMQVQASSASSRINFLCKTLIESYYKAQSQLYPQNQGDQMAMTRLDHMSCKMAHQKGASQLPSNSGLQQAQKNSGKCVEGYECDFQSCDVDGRVDKVDADSLQKKSNWIEIDICNSGSKRKGAMLGADVEAVLPSHYGDCSSSKTEGLISENSIASDSSPRASTLEYQHMGTDLHSSKRSRKTLHHDEKMLDSFHSEKILAECRGAKDSKDPEDIQLHCRAELTKASVDAMEYSRLTACEKDSREQHHGLLHASNQGDVLQSCLGEHPRHGDHLASSSLVNHSGLPDTPVKQNIVGSMQHSAENITLQTRVDYSGKSASSSSRKKIDIASVLSLPWIQRWCPSYQIKSSIFETHCGSAATRGINLKSLSVKTLPSAAAMAIVGIASQQLQPCKRQNKRSSRV